MCAVRCASLPACSSPLSDPNSLSVVQSLRTISIDFLLNLLANLKRLRIGHYLILTTQQLCRRLQEEHCEYSCAWTTLWHNHPGLSQWNLRAGDMWAKLAAGPCARIHKGACACACP